MSSARVALVTGAARGQGWAIAERLRADGFAVVAGDINEAELHAAVTGRADDALIGVRLDVTRPEQWHAAVATTVQRFGALTALINNAGTLHRATIAEETPEDFEKSWRVNCLGAFLGIQAALDLLREAEGAAIVNTCSTGAIRPFSAAQRLRVIEVGTARPDPDRCRGTHLGGHPGQRGVSRADRHADARRRDSAAPGRGIGGWPTR